MIYLHDSKNASSQKPMAMLSGSILEQCQFSRFISVIDNFPFVVVSFSFYIYIIYLTVKISLSVQVYGDTSFQDCRRASEEAIEIIIKNLQVCLCLLVLVVYNGLN